MAVHAGNDRTCSPKLNCAEANFLEKSSILNDLEAWQQSDHDAGVLDAFGLPYWQTRSCMCLCFGCQDVVHSLASFRFITMLPKSALDIADDVEGLDEEKWNLQVVQKRPPRAVKPFTFLRCPSN